MEKLVSSIKVRCPNNEGKWSVFGGVPLNGLVFYAPLWHPDLNGSSFISKDLNAHSCTVTGATWGLQGRTFDGVDDYIEVAHHASQLLTTGGSIEAWIKPDTVGENNAGYIVDKSTDTSGGGGYRFGCRSDSAGNRVGLILSGGGTKMSDEGSVIFGDGNWYHVVATWDATGSVTIYVNGSQSGTPSISADPAGITTTNAMRIGNRSGATDRTFDGVIGEVSITSHIYTLAEVQNRRQATKGRYQ